MFVFISKHRNSICSLDLILYFGEGAYKPKIFAHDVFQLIEYTQDKYVILVRDEIKFLTEEKQTKTGEFSILVDHRFFVWSVVSVPGDHDHEHKHLFQGTFFISPVCDMNHYYDDTCITHVTQLEQVQRQSLRLHMDTSAISIRKKLFWRPQPALNYRKLGRDIKIASRRTKFQKRLKHRFLFVHTQSHQQIQFYWNDEYKCNNF